MGNDFVMDLLRGQALAILWENKSIGFYDNTHFVTQAFCVYFVKPLFVIRHDLHNILDLAIQCSTYL